MKKRTERLLTIKRIISSYRISSQEELLDKLEELGFNYTQATLSRDLKFLKVAKVVDETLGYVYVLPEMRSFREEPKSEPNLPINGFLSLDFSDNFAVIKTLPGYAASIAFAIDNLKAYEILGTIAGDDTILIIPREKVLRTDLRNLLAMVIPEIDK
ncbi:arginine repressor [Bacteroidota bacterium]